MTFSLCLLDANTSDFFPHHQLKLAFWDELFRGFCFSICLFSFGQFSTLHSNFQLMILLIVLHYLARHALLTDFFMSGRSSSLPPGGSFTSRYILSLAWLAPELPEQSLVAQLYQNNELCLRFIAAVYYWGNKLDLIVTELLRVHLFYFEKRGYLSFKTAAPKQSGVYRERGLWPRRRKQTKCCDQSNFARATAVPDSSSSHVNTILCAHLEEKE